MESIEESVGAPAPPRRISDDLQAWCDDRRRLQHSDLDVRKGRRAIEKIAADCGWVSRANIHQADAPAWLAQRMQGRWSSKTHDNHVDYLRRWGRCMVNLGHWEDSPFESLASIGQEAEQGMGAFTFEEAWAIIDAAKEQGLTHFCRWPRWTLYVFLLYTGLRVGEADKIRVDDLRLEQEFPALIVRKEVAKNRRRWVLPLHPVAVEAVRHVLAEPGTVKNARRSKGLLFPAMPADETIHNDMQAADVPKVNAEGESRCYHSFRKTFETVMASCGMHDRYPDYFMRHMTALKVRYFKPTPAMLAAEIAKFPSCPVTALLSKGNAQPGGKESGENLNPPLDTGGENAESGGTRPMHNDQSNQLSSTDARSLGRRVGLVNHESPDPGVGRPERFARESAPNDLLVVGTGVERRGGDSNPRLPIDPCAADLLACFEAQLAGVNLTARLLRSALTRERSA